VNFPFICSNFTSVSAYGVYISQLIQYSRACGSYHDFLDRSVLLIRKLLKQGFLLVRLKSSLQKFYLLTMLRDICVTNYHGIIPFFVITIRSFSHLCLIIGFVTRVTQRVPLVEQELPTFQE
jgi:hypothetical protein